VEAFRYAYQFSTRVCDVPWCDQPVHVLHEIARGPSRAAALDRPAAILRLCNACHEEVHAVPVPVACQLAIKKLSDPETYDRLEVNRLRHRAPESITEPEVQGWADAIREGWRWSSSGGSNVRV
jgi:hypothetical protein